MARKPRVITPKTNIPSLVRWGVSAHADLVFRALSTFGAQDCVELARSLGLPERPVRAALDELHGLGAAAPLRDGHRPPDRVWRPCPADTVVHALRARQARLARARHQLQRQLSTVDIIGTSAAELRAARPILGVPAVRTRLGELLSAERREHLAMNPESAFTATSAKAAVAASRPAMQRGVTTWTLGVPATSADQSEAHIRELYSHGLQYRELPRQPIKLMIMDRTTAFLPLDPAANFSRGVWEVSSPSVVEQLVSFFMQHWSNAIEPSTQGWLPPKALSEREKAILALLASGATDAAAAAKLNLSVRTIAYTLKDLMERSGVQTRFQLGLVLGTQAAQMTSETDHERGVAT